MTRSKPAMVGVAILAYAIYVAAAAESPLFDAAQRDRIAFLRANIEAEGRPFSENQRRQAESYFQQNPDVAQDVFFGLAGPMGIRGALEHFRRHGRHEGRVWPETGGGN